MPKLEIPVIGIGAGPATDGQVLVFHDLLGIYDGHTPKFVKRYADVRERDRSKGVRAYAEEVRARRFPDEDEHTYSIPQEELEEFARYLEEESAGRHRHPLGLVARQAGSRACRPIDAGTRSARREPPRPARPR